MDLDRICVKSRKNTDYSTIKKQVFPNKCGKTILFPLCGQNFAR